MKKVSILLTVSVLASLFTLAVVPFITTMLRQDGGMEAPIDGVAVTRTNRLLGKPLWDPGEPIERDGFNYAYASSEGGDKPFDVMPEPSGNTLVATGADPNHSMTTIGSVHKEGIGNFPIQNGGSFPFISGQTQDTFFMHAANPGKNGMRVGRNNSLSRRASDGGLC